MSLGVFLPHLEMRFGNKSSVFHIYIKHNNKNYKVMIDVVVWTLSPN